jgi:hypothetical protein
VYVCVFSSDCSYLGDIRYVDIPSVAEIHIELPYYSFLTSLPVYQEYYSLSLLPVELRKAIGLLSQMLKVLTDSYYF